MLFITFDDFTLTIFCDWETPNIKKFEDIRKKYGINFSIVIRFCMLIMCQHSLFNCMVFLENNVLAFTGNM